jgi:antiphage defense system Thoeris ThsB-like protein
MAIKRAFIAFDFEHDEDLRNLLGGQAKNPESPFEIKDRSIKEPLTGDWKDKVRQRMDNVDLVIVLCGEHTHEATGVGAELTIARERKKPYFLLWGRSGKTCTKPTSALSTDKMYQWTWDNLKSLISGNR